MILVNDPYFNEPGYARSQGTPSGERQSEVYNANIRKQTLLHAILPFCSGTHSYPEFKDAIDAHFSTKKRLVEKQMYQWMAKDSSLTGTVNQILPQFARFHVNSKPSSRAARAKVAPTPIKEVNGVIELLEDEQKPPAAKKQKTNEVVELLDEDDDAKPAAIAREPIVLDLT